MGSSGAGAFVGIDEIDAGSSILARVGQALIDLLRAVNSMITSHALQGGKRGAVRDVHPVATRCLGHTNGCSVPAPGATTTPRKGPTQPSLPSPCPTAPQEDSTHLAGVASQVIRAGGSVLAGVWGALVHLLLAVAAGVAGLAAAEVSVAGVHAEPRVPAEVCDVDTCRGEHRETRGPQ